MEHNVALRSPVAVFLVVGDQNQREQIMYNV